MRAVGEQAPDFSATLPDGRSVRLSDFRGRRPVVLYFFPKAFTPGCTREAQGFRDRYAELSKLGAEVIGVSLDAPERQEAFARAQRVPFPMIGDSNKEIGRVYGVLRLGGWLLAKRVTFVIDKEGIVRRVIHSELDIDGHVDGAAEALQKLSG